MIHKFYFHGHVETGDPYTNKYALRGSHNHQEMVNGFTYIDQNFLFNPTNPGLMEYSNNYADVEKEILFQNF